METTQSFDPVKNRYNIMTVVDSTDLVRDFQRFRDRIEHQVASAVADEVMKQLGPAIHEAVQKVFVEPNGK